MRKLSPRGYADWDFVLSYKSNRGRLRHFGAGGGPASLGAPEVWIPARGMLSSWQPPASGRVKAFFTKGTFFANVYLWRARAVISVANLRRCSLIDKKVFILRRLEQVLQLDCCVDALPFCFSCWKGGRTTSRLPHDQPLRSPWPISPCSTRGSSTALLK